MKLILDGKHFDEGALKELIDLYKDDSSEGWQREIVESLEEWIDDDDFVIFHTSGSTGKPKRIKHSKKSMKASAKKTGNFFDIRPGNRALLCLPAKLVAGKMMIVRALTLDLILECVKPSANPLEDNDHDFHFAAMTPHQVSTILTECPERLENLGFLLIGGAPVSDELNQKLQEISTPCFLTYGMTETITHVAVKNLNGPDRSSYFRALPGVNLTKDKHDCLVIEADHLDQPKVVTNDIVNLIKPGCFEWIGRRDNIVNSGGYKIYPENLERKVSRIINKRFFFCGIPDDLFGERLVLFIEGRVYSRNEEKNLLDNMRRVLDPFEMPKKIYFVPLFKSTPSGKIKKAAKFYEY